MKVLMIFLYLLPINLWAAAGVKSVFLKESDVLHVSTKLGFSTKLIFEQAPKAGLVGDQDAFAVEYLGKVVSIKPLIPGSYTNLFVPTREGHFNFILKTIGKKPDNVIKVHRFREKVVKAPVHTDTKLYARAIDRVGNCGDQSLRLVHLKSPKSVSTWVVDFELKIKAPLSTQAYEELQQRIFLFQGEQSIPIEGIHTEVIPQKSGALVKGAFHFRNHPGLFDKNSKPLRVLLQQTPKEDSKCPYIEVKFDLKRKKERR